VLAMSIFYLLVTVTTLMGDRPHKVSFVVASGVATLIIGIAMDRYHEQSGHNDES